MPWSIQFVHAGPQFRVMVDGMPANSIAVLSSSRTAARIDLIPVIERMAATSSSNSMPPTQVQRSNSTSRPMENLEISAVSDSRMEPKLDSPGTDGISWDEKKQTQDLSQTKNAVESVRSPETFSEKVNPLQQHDGLLETTSTNDRRKTSDPVEPFKISTTELKVFSCSTHGIGSTNKITPSQTQREIFSMPIAAPEEDSLPLKSRPRGRAAREEFKRNLYASLFEKTDPSETLDNSPKTGAPVAAVDDSAEETKYSSEDIDEITAFKEELKIEQTENASNSDKSLETTSKDSLAQHEKPSEELSTEIDMVNDPVNTVEITNLSFVETETTYRILTREEGQKQEQMNNTLSSGISSAMPAKDFFAQHSKPSEEISAKNIHETSNDPANIVETDTMSSVEMKAISEIGPRKEGQKLDQKENGLNSNINPGVPPENSSSQRREPSDATAADIVHDTSNDRANIVPSAEMKLTSDTSDKMASSEDKQPKAQTVSNASSISEIHSKDSQLQHSKHSETNVTTAAYINTLNDSQKIGEPIKTDTFSTAETTLPSDTTAHGLGTTLSQDERKQTITENSVSTLPMSPSEASVLQQAKPSETVVPDAYKSWVAISSDTQHGVVGKAWRSILITDLGVVSSGPGDFVLRVDILMDDKHVGRPEYVYYEEEKASLRVVITEELIILSLHPNTSASKKQTQAFFVEELGNAYPDIIAQDEQERRDEEESRGPSDNGTVRDAFDPDHPLISMSNVHRIKWQPKARKWLETHHIYCTENGRKPGNKYSLIHFDDRVASKTGLTGVQSWRGLDVNQYVRILELICYTATTVDDLSTPGTSGAGHMSSMYTVQQRSTTKLAGIQLIYEINGERRIATKHSAIKRNVIRTESRFRLSPGEDIIEISGRKGTDFIEMLKFKTSFGRTFSSTHSAMGSPFELDIPSNARVVSVFGSHLNFVESIGFVYEVDQDYESEHKYYEKCPICSKELAAVLQERQNTNQGESSNANKVMDDHIEKCLEERAIQIMESKGNPERQREERINQLPLSILRMELLEREKEVEHLREQLEELARMDSEVAREIASRIRSTTCKICFMERINVVLLHCGHQIMCHGCAHELFQRRKPCPICNSPIIKVQRFYET